MFDIAGAWWERDQVAYICVLLMPQILQLAQFIHRLWKEAALHSLPLTDKRRSYTRVATQLITRAVCLITSSALNMHSRARAAPTLDPRAHEAAASMYICAPSLHYIYKCTRCHVRQRAASSREEFLVEVGHWNAQGKTCLTLSALCLSVEGAHLNTHTHTHTSQSVDWSVSYL